MNEKTGDIVQVTKGGYTGMLNIAKKSMKLYFMRNDGAGNQLEVLEVNLATLFTDRKKASLKPATEYQRICGSISAASTSWTGIPVR